MLFLVLLLAAGLLTGCTGSKEPDAETIFTKTIHDFDGYRVDNLDESEETNFAVYAEGVKEIPMTEEGNLLLSADDENYIYTFGSPDETLLSMEAGDVFFGVAPTPTSPSVTIKVKSLEISDGGTAVTVYGEKMELDDLFKYVDIQMDASLADAYYDPDALPEDTEILLVSDSPQALVCSSDPSYLPGVQLSDMAADISARRDVNLAIRTGLGIQRDAVKVTGELGASLDRVFFEFRFSAKDRYFHSGLVIDWGYHADLEAKSTGDLFDQKVKIPNIWIPVGGIFNVAIQPTFNYSLSGSISGSIRYSKSYSQGILCSASVASGVSVTPVDESFDPVTTTDISMLEGKLTVGLELCPKYGVNYIANIYAAAFGGCDVLGSYDPLRQLHKEENKDYIHDCSICIDGDINAVARLTAGAELFFGGGDLCKPEVKLAEAEWKVGDFYISLKMGDQERLDYGMGECPYIRHRVNLSVLMPSGEAATHARVTARYPDGRTDNTMADESGGAVLFLPAGDNTVSASLTGYTNDMHVAVEDSPVSATLRLEEGDSTVYIVYDLTDYTTTDSLPLSSFDYQELASVLWNMFPEAVFINENLDGSTVSDKGISWDTLAKEYEWAPGDIVIQLSSFLGLSTIDTLYAHEYRHVDPDPRSPIFPYSLTLPEDEIKQFLNFDIWLWIVLDTSSEMAETSNLFTLENGLTWCRMYHAQAQIHADIDIMPTCTHGKDVEHICECPVTDEWIRWNGSFVIEGGVLFDKNYRVTGREEAVQYTWDVDEHRSPHNTAKELHQDKTLPYTVAQYANRIYPYVKLLQDGEYFEKIGEVMEADQTIH